MVYCPECESDLDIEEDEVDEGEVVSCPECGTDFEIVDPESLEPVSTISKPTLIAVAAFVGNTRLIDNIIVIP